MTTANRGFFAERKWLVELAVKYRLPAIYFQKSLSMRRPHVLRGGLR